jgi:hypothetical protein
LLPAMRFGVFSYWDNSYWGGAAAAIGGALVLGSLPRIARRCRVRDTLILGTGIAILANTRPYEGLILSLSAAVTLLLWIRARKGDVNRHMLMYRFVAPAIFLLGLVATSMGYYFARVTSDPFRMPEQANRDSYAIATLFYWQSPNPQPTYRHKVMFDFYNSLEFSQYLRSHSLRGFVEQTSIKIARIWGFYIGPAFTFSFLFLHRMVRSRRMRWLLAIGAVSFAGSAVVIFFNIHYVAPITAVILAIILQGMRHLRAWSFHEQPTGLFLARSAVVICVLMMPLETRVLAAQPQAGTLAAMGRERAALLTQLKAIPGRHLVLVRYDTNHDPRIEWVYNEANIDASRIVWARDMGAAGNREIIQYYQDRVVWLLEPDRSPPKLSPYTLAGTTFDLGTVDSDGDSARASPGLATEGTPTIQQQTLKLRPR